METRPIYHWLMHLSWGNKLPSSWEENILCNSSIHENRFPKTREPLFRYQVSFFWPTLQTDVKDVSVVTNSSSLFKAIERKSGVVLNKYSLALILEEMMMRVKHPRRRFLTIPASMTSMNVFGFFLVFAVILNWRVFTTLHLFLKLQLLLRDDCKESRWETQEGDILDSQTSWEWNVEETGVTRMMMITVFTRQELSGVFVRSKMATRRTNESVSSIVKMVTGWWSVKTERDSSFRVFLRHYPKTLSWDTRKRCLKEKKDLDLM